MANEFDNFPLYYLKLIADTQDMSTLEFGAYMRLLLRAWVETPPGSLPDDSRVLARYAGLTPLDWSQISPTVLLRFLPPRNGRIVQKMMTQLYEGMRRKIEEKSILARRGAKAKWDKKKHADALQKNADALHMHPDPPPTPSLPSSPIPLSPIPTSPPTPPVTSREGVNLDLPPMRTEDELDGEIRAFIAHHPMLPPWDQKMHGKLRRLVEIANWDKAKELIGEAVGKGIDFPIGWALGKLAGIEQKEAAKTPKPKPAAKTMQKATVADFG